MRLDETKKKEGVPKEGPPLLYQRRSPDLELKRGRTGALGRPAKTKREDPRPRIGIEKGIRGFTKDREMSRHTPVKEKTRTPVTAPRSRGKKENVRECAKVYSKG